MRMGSEVGFEEVRATFLRDNADTPERNDWPMGALEAANRQFGNWIKVVITPEEVRTVMLPYHNHRGVGLVPPTGSSVLEAIQKLESVDLSSECYRRIQQFSSPRVTAVFLSAAPINDPRYSDYNGLLERGCNGLIHLDGLHRLIAWGRDNRPEVRAYLAVSV
jgi:hypothetical protein